MRWLLKWQRQMYRKFSHQQYLNLETFRKTGAGVKTPVWFVQDQEIIYVRTSANSGKVKRIHNNPCVNIAPCKMDGTLVGDWLPALAGEVNDEVTARKVDQLLGKKYGILKKLFSKAAECFNMEYTILKLKGRV